jgi:hypothetical protein
MIGDHLIGIAGIRSLSINNTAYDISIFYNVNINYGDIKNSFSGSFDSSFSPSLQLADDFRFSLDF